MKQIDLELQQAAVRCKPWIDALEKARAAEGARWGVGGVRAQLWEKDIREFGISVQRDSAKRLTLMEPISCKAPSIARPYCCYLNTVIFYMQPHQLDRNGQNFREWERVETVLMWDEQIVFEGEQYIVGGGRVIRHGKAWWMKRWARLREPVRWAAGAGVCDGNGESKSAAQTAKDQGERQNPAR